MGHLAARCAHEAISTEINEVATFMQDLDQLVAKMPPAYTDHMVTRRCRPRKALPLALISLTRRSTRRKSPSLVSVW